MAISIAVAGKGGTGKTTLAGLFIRELCEQNKGPVLAIDADPDSNLGALLGIKVTQSIGDLREEVLENLKNFPAGLSKADFVQAGLHQIIEEAECFDLVTMGRGEGAGCYCYLNSLIRRFSEELFPLYRWIVMDNEAGLEHISRRTTYNIDALLVVVNDNPISLNTARTIEKVISQLKNEIKKVYVVTNMVRDKRKEELVERIRDLQMNYLGDIPYDEGVDSAVFHGQSLLDIQDYSAKKIIKKLIAKIGGENADT
jgi:CO dehydrogenase maturation factor